MTAFSMTGTTLCVTKGWQSGYSFPTGIQRVPQIQVLHYPFRDLVKYKTSSEMGLQQKKINHWVVFLMRREGLIYFAPSAFLIIHDLKTLTISTKTGSS